MVGSSCSGGSAAHTSTASTTAATAPATGLPAGATPVGVRDLRTGQCFDVPKDDPDATDRAVWSLPCTDVHTHEVYDEVAYGGPSVKGGGYAGTAVVQDWAEQACFDRFEQFVGKPWTTSSFEIETWWPSADSWGRGDRVVVCSVFPSDGGHTTGTARGADR